MVEVQLTVNGKPVTATVPRDMTLLRYLRDQLRLTGTKCGCGGGECGTCTVLVDGEPKKSCLLRMKTMQGAQVVTIEGLSADGLHPIQTAFILKGAIQCGFCTPGLIMAAKALLDRKASPSREDILSALKGNYCRCTGYFAVIEAVEEAARILSGQRDTKVGSPVDFGPDIIGASVLDKSDIFKATGQLVFADDLYFDGMCYGAALLSDLPHAVIKSIETSKAESMQGVVRVLTAKDIPGINKFGLIHADQPVFPEDKVRFVGDALALVIADTEENARKALQLIHVDFEELPVVASPDDALKESHLPPVHESGHVPQESHPLKRGYRRRLSEGGSHCGAGIRDAFCGTRVPGTRVRGGTGDGGWWS